MRKIDAQFAASDLTHEFLSREVTILLADLRGFTAMAATMAPREIVEMLNPFLIQMSEIIFRHQGTIDKFMGDSIMVLFGAPVSRDDDVCRALACAVDMQIAMGAINRMQLENGRPELFMGIGINTGPVLAGVLGGERYSAYTVIGDQVNLASRIETFSLRGQVLISQSTYEHCDGFVETRDPMDVYVKGKPQPVRVREVVAIPSLGLTVPRQENRRSHRVAVRLPMAYQRIHNGIVLPASRQGTVHDLGFHGVLIEVEDELPCYAEVKLGFDLPLVDYEARDLYAKVVACKPMGEGFLLGVEFTSLPPDASLKIQLFVQLRTFTESA